MSRVINPQAYEYFLKGHAPCNYSLNSHTLYRSLARPAEIQTPLQIEAFYRFDYNDMRIDYAFRTFPFEDERMYNVVMVTNKGIYKEDFTRSIIDDQIFMRWTFVTKIADRNAKLIVTNEYNTKHLIWFYPASVTSSTDTVTTILDTAGISHEMDTTDQLKKALTYGTEYVDVDTMCYVPVWNFRMWYMMF